jgi:DNA replication protein DnaC
MPYSENVLRRARERLAAEKREAEEQTARRRSEAFAQFPRLKQIETELRITMADAMAACFQKNGDPQAAIAEIKEKNLALQREREWILEAADLGADYLDDQPVCPTCGGSGYVGEKMCDCLRELCRQEQKKELSSLLGGRESFDTFRLSYYSDRPDPTYGVSPRENMKSVLRDVQNYAANFVPGQSGSMLFSGGTGLGKTFLSACVARAVADRGASVVYDTAVRLFADFEAEKFGNDPNKPTEKYLLCDLLIIDDLGTEMTTQFTQSALYTVINTRLMAKRATIISTNLSMQDIRARYSPQIVSRLMGTFEDVYFFGDDIRLIQKNRS